MSKLKLALTTLVVFVGALSMMPSKTYAQEQAKPGVSLPAVHIIADSHASLSCDQDELTSENCTIVAYTVRAINILSALAGIAITASIMIAGFQYMTARDNAGQIEAARKRIVWALLALGIFIFTYAFLNFIVPGGLIG